MTEFKKAILEKVGIEPKDFEPKQDATEERISELEDALIELASILMEG